jgi:hypothetical protein
MTLLSGMTSETGALLLGDGLVQGGGAEGGGRGKTVVRRAVEGSCNSLGAYPARGGCQRIHETRPGMRREGGERKAHREASDEGVQGLVPETVAFTSRLIPCPGHLVHNRKYIG